MAVLLTGFLVEWNPTGSLWVDITTSVISVSGDGAFSGSRDNALAFGDSSATQISVVVKDALTATAWKKTPIRVTYTVGAASGTAFAGIITKRDRNTSDAELTFNCIGFAELIRTTRAYSLLFHRTPVATKTTAASQEDPTLPSYIAGPMNWILWQAGGRPLEQNFTYTNPAFYYSCDQALISPNWSWLAGEDGWSECLKLAQASGGQVYQDSAGVVRYRQPYAIADASSVFTFDESVYDENGISETDDVTPLVTQVTCAYVSRELRPTQAVVEVTTPRLIHIGETITLVNEPAQPLYTLDAPTAANFVITTADYAVPVLGVDYTVAIVWAAQRITMTVTNLMSIPLSLWKYTLKGQPVIAGPTGSVTLGSGTSQKTISDNAYIQTEHDARRLCALVLKFYGVTRPVRSFGGCVFDPARAVGEVVGLSNVRWSMSAELHIITKIAHDDTGLFSDYELAYVGDLNKTSDYYQVGPTYASAKFITV
jgi:hypothetical protein